MNRLLSILLSFVLMGSSIGGLPSAALAASTPRRTMLYIDEVERYWLETTDGVSRLFAEIGQESHEFPFEVIDARVVNATGIVLLTTDDFPILALAFAGTHGEIALSSIDEYPPLWENMRAIGRKSYSSNDASVYAAWDSNGKLVLWYSYGRKSINLGGYQECFVHPDGYFFWTTAKGDLQAIDPGAKKPVTIKLGKIKEGSFFRGAHYVAWEDAKGLVNFWPFTVDKPIQIGSTQDARFSAESVELTVNGATQIFNPNDYSAAGGGPSLSFETSTHTFWSERQKDRHFLYGKSKTDGKLYRITEDLMNARVVDDQVLVLSDDDDGYITLYMVQWTSSGEPRLYWATWQYPSETFNGAWKIAPYPISEQEGLYYLASKVFSNVAVDFIGANVPILVFKKDHDTIEYHPHGFFYLTGAKTGLTVGITYPEPPTKSPVTVSLGKFDEESLHVGETYIAWTLKGQVYYWTLGLKKAAKLGAAEDVTFFPSALVLRKADQLFQAIPAEGGALVEITEAELHTLSQP